MIYEALKTLLLWPKPVRKTELQRSKGPLGKNDSVMNRYYRHQSKLTEHVELHEYKMLSTAVRAQGVRRLYAS